MELYKSSFSEPPWNETWLDEQVKKRLDLALSKDGSICLVAQEIEILIGFIWGYKLPSDKFPFLYKGIPEKTTYIDEIAVRRDKRKSGAARELMKEYLKISIQQGMEEVLGTTDERNEACLALVRSFGYREIKDENGQIVRSPKRYNSIYLKKELK